MTKVLVGNITGPEGPQGDPGTPGSPGAPGAPGTPGTIAVAINPNIVFDGDSLMFGAGGLPYGMFPHGQDAPSQVVGSLPAEGTYHNVAVGGETIATMLANAPTAVDVLKSETQTNVVVIGGGSNDIFYTDVDPTANIASYCSGRKTAGFKVVVCTITPRTDTGVPADFETKRQAVNTSIRANWHNYADAIADFADDPLLADSTDKRYYNGDGAHHNVNGYEVRTSYILKALATLGIHGHIHNDKPVLNSDLWLPANMLAVQAATADPTYGNILATAFSGWKLAHGQVQIVGVTTLLPQDWMSFDVYAVYTWVPEQGGETDPGFALIVGNTLPFGIVGYATAFNMATVPTGGAPTQVKPAAYLANSVKLCTNVKCANGVSPRTAWNIEIERNGQAPQDTMADDIEIIGIYLQRTS